MTLRTSLIALVLCAACAAVSCRRAETPANAPLIDPGQYAGEKALAEVRNFVAIGPRIPGTPGSATAADYLQERLKGFGLAPMVDVFHSDTPHGDTVFRNVLARLPGKEPGVIVLVSHYDTKAGIANDFVGANDSGSSTGLLLEMARLLALPRATLPGPSILFAFVDGEEALVEYGPKDGLYGSYRLSMRIGRERKKDPVHAVIVVDMIGDKNLNVTIPPNTAPTLRKLALDAAHEGGVRSFFSLGEQDILDDHVPFMQANLPAVNLIDFHYGAWGRNDYWHTREDTMDKLSAESLEIVGRTVLRMLNRLSAPPTAAESEK